MECMVPQQLYDIFIGFEERAADVYMNLALRFNDKPDVSWFWVEMAMEETQHAGMLQYCKETGMFASHLPTTEQIQRLAAMFKTVRRSAASPEITLDQAFEVAITLESSEMNEIYSDLTANVTGPWYVIRKKIELSISNHFERLREASNRFDVAVDIRTKLGSLTRAA